jgi:sugar lactone lactonase YvrE
MRETRLFCKLPEEYVCTPDGMAIDRYGNLVLSCPNFAQDNMPGCVVKIDKDTREVKKWFDVPVHPGTGVARNMGIAFDDDWNLYLCDNQGWSERPGLLYQGRVLKVRADDDGNILESRVVAYRMEHPNGIRVRDGYMYVTQSYLHPIEDPSGRLVSGVYRFRLDEENVEITNTYADKNLFCTFLTGNPDCQYGADGIAFNSKGELFVGNFGDGEVYKIIIDDRGHIVENAPFAKDPAQLVSTDGLCVDDDDNIYVADFSYNSIAKITPGGKVERIAQSPDTDGFNGELDQPGEPIVYQGRIIASCFDLVTGPGKVNTAHELPATLSEMDL